MYEIHIEFHVLREFPGIFFLNPLHRAPLHLETFLQT